MLNERHLAYSTPRPAPFLGPDERYVVVRFAPDKLGNPSGPGKYEVLVDDGRNVIGWQYPMRFDGDDAGETTARAKANSIWTDIRRAHAENLVRQEEAKEQEKVRRAQRIAAVNA